MIRTRELGPELTDNYKYDLNGTDSLHDRIEDIQIILIIHLEIRNPKKASN